MSNRIMQIVFGSEELGEPSQVIIALVLGVAAGISGCYYIVHSPSYASILFNPLFFIEYFYDAESIEFHHPSFIHACVALAVVMPLYLRNMIRFNNRSVTTGIFFIVNMFLFAAVAQIVLGESDSFSGTITSYTLIVAISLGWVGMRSVAGISWIIFFAIAAYNIVCSSEQMSWWGFWFVVTSVLSLFFQTSMNFTEFVSGFSREFSRSLHGTSSEEIKKNVQHGAASIEKVMTNVAKKKK